MIAALGWSWQLDGWIIVAGGLCAAAAALLGNFLLLRRMSLLGDAISHAVLPGLAAAFLLSGSRQSWPMFAGAIVVGILTAVATECLRGAGRVDEGASLGVVFSTLFAAGLVLIVRAADHVDLDPSCVLYGAIETTPLDTVAWGSWRVPRAVVMLAAVFVVNATFVAVLFKELKLSSFDPELATASGYSARGLHYLLMILVAVTAVASFESVGNILVVAMFIVPPATAYLLVGRLGPMVVLSVVLAFAAAVLGHLAAVLVPRSFGLHSTMTAGMMAVAAGVLFVAAWLGSPRQGIVVAWWRRRTLARKILQDDILALLFRSEERGGVPALDLAALANAVLVPPRQVRSLLPALQRAGWVDCRQSLVGLTAAGRRQAATLVRSHRLWEHYLAVHTGLDPQRIHDKAEQLEHFTDAALRAQLHVATNAATVDPHGSPIPAEVRGGAATAADSPPPS